MLYLVNIIVYIHSLSNIIGQTPEGVTSYKNLLKFAYMVENRSDQLTGTYGLNSLDLTCL